MSLKVDAAFQRNDNQRVYFIVGDNVFRYDLEVGKKLDDGFPKKVKDYWKGLPFDKIDAVYKAKHAAKLYFFSGDMYARYDIDGERMDEGYPRRIKESWNGLPFDTIDAICSRNKVFVDVDKEVFEKVLLFKGNEFAVYNLDADKVEEGYPKRISERLSIPFDSVDAIFQHLDHPEFYVFKDDQYLVYNIETKTVKEGYPKAVDAGWVGVFEHA